MEEQVDSLQKLSIDRKFLKGYRSCSSSNTYLTDSIGGNVKSNFQCRAQFGSKFYDTTTNRTAPNPDNIFEAIPFEVAGVAVVVAATVETTAVEPVVAGETAVDDGGAEAAVRGNAVAPAIDGVGEAVFPGVVIHFAGSHRGCRTSVATERLSEKPMWQLITLDKAASSTFFLDEREFQNADKTLTTICDCARLNSINSVRPQQPLATASRMQRLALLFVCLLGSAVALPARTRLWSRGNSRIIGGSNANIANYPWQLSFQYGGSHICGASIISSTWALTAAHCVDGMSLLLMTFRAGSSIRGSGGTVQRASSGYMHASYDSNTVDYDVAVVQVSGSLLGTNAQAVSLPSDGYDPAGGLAVTVTGWGSTYTDGPAPSNLQKLDISIVARSTCQSIFANVNTVTARMVCAGSAGQSVCSGDSGGPLVSGSTQVGIVSWGVSPCEASPGVYANVGNLRSWIRSAAGV
ncbi:trypsin delta-like [Schistocerca nitens]|uniref:trypsin delta-like n=1 Tax=Schistocerca nitens TaxID=7011 RepID=UPI002117F6B6|nr:trypsin delta-like [Schistocerca nitens]